MSNKIVIEMQLRVIFGQPFFNSHSR